MSEIDYYWDEYLYNMRDEDLRTDEQLIEEFRELRVKYFAKKRQLDEKEKLINELYDEVMKENEELKVLNHMFKDL